MAQTRKMLEFQIKKLEEKRSDLMLAIARSETEKVPSSYYALTNKLKNLYKKLEDAKRFDYLAM